MYSAKRLFSTLQALKADDFSRPPAVLAQTAHKAIPMVLRGLWWKIWFKKSEGITLIGKRVTIRNPQNISIGKNFVAEDYCEIQGLSKKGIIFGNNVSIGSFAMIRPSGYYKREIGQGLVCGDYSNIGPYGYIGCSGQVSIGNNVLMGPRVSIFGENHNFKRTDIPIKAQGVTRHDVVIKDDCWLASGSIILAGVTLGKSVIVAAGAVVTDDVPDYAIVAGVPAKVINWRSKPEE